MKGGGEKRRKRKVKEKGGGGGLGRRKGEEGKRMRWGKVNGKMEGREWGKTRAEKRRGRGGGGRNE